MRKVQLYIEGNRVELFNDEQIQLTSSIQNVQDISKTFTDFSQGFTVPSSDANNALFEHWYNSDINFTTDNNLRKDAFIEINLSTFRKGKVQLDGATLTNGKPSSYKLTFYGEGVTLKDTFGEDLLSDLDYSALTHDFTSEEVRFRIEDATNYYDVKYPLITSNRIWEYQSTPVNVPFPNWLTNVLTQNDIHTNSGAIYKEELFPAVRVSKIFEEIENKYGITFKGVFLQDQRFTDLFLWFKGKEVLVQYSIAQNLVSNTITPTFTNYDLTNAYTSATNTIQVQELAGVITHRLIYEVTATTTSENYSIDIYQNGNLYNTITGFGPDIYTLDVINQTVGLDVAYTFNIRTEGSNVIDSELRYEVDYITTGTVNTDYLTVVYNSLTINLMIDLAANAPVMKIADFFSGILKVFNMTVYSLNDGEYWVEPLDDWYSKGAVIDVSEYVDVNTIEHSRMPLYKKITFKYQDSECFLNQNFSQTFNKAYGNTTYQYNYDGGEFTVELPFENLLQQKFNGTQELLIGYSLNKEFSPYIPKPVLLYQYKNLDCDFKFLEDDTSHSNITNYTPFGQDLFYNNTDYTLNFAPETSTILNYPIQNTLFANYYFSYLYNLYNIKQRLVSVKAKLPVSLLTGMQLNDRLMIRDRRYIINEMKVNLTSGDVDLQLILDFRPVINSTLTNPNVSTSGGTVLLPVLFPTNTTQVDFSSSSPDVSFASPTFYSEGLIEVTLPSGSAGMVYDAIFDYTYTNGTTSTETFYIFQ